MAGLPGPARMLVENMLGLDLSFEIAGAPSDEVEQVFFYVKTTSQMTTHLRNRTETLSGEFARLFAIEANARTAEGLSKIAGAAEKIDPSTMTSPQKQWVKDNRDEFAGLAYAMVGIGQSGLSLVTAVGAAGEKVTKDPVQYKPMLFRYFSGDASSAIDSAVSDATSIYDDVPPIAKNVSSISTAVNNIGKAQGLEPPTEERSKQLADKAASSAIGDDVTFG